MNEAENKGTKEKRLEETGEREEKRREEKRREEKRENERKNSGPASQTTSLNDTKHLMERIGS
jgi:hypothetical protein